MPEHHGSTKNPANDVSVLLDAQVPPTVYHAKALRAQTRLHEALDLLDEMERTHAEQLAAGERREGRMRAKMKGYSEKARKAEEECEDMRKAVEGLVEKVEKVNGYKNMKPNQMHVSSLLEPIRPSPSKQVPSAEAEELLSYAASMIEVARKERNLERKAHQKTKEWAQARISSLEAQLARREAELARCVTHCHEHSVPDPTLPRDGVRLREELLSSPLDTLQWTVGRNKSLEMEIHTLNERLAEMRVQNSHSDAPAPPDYSLVQGLDEQVRALGSLVDGLKADTDNWRKVLDAEKSKDKAAPRTSPSAIEDRLRSLEEECSRLRRSDDELRKRLESTQHQEHVRDLEMKQRIELLDSQITALTLAQAQSPHPLPPTPPQEYADGDLTIRASSRQSPPRSTRSSFEGSDAEQQVDLLDDGQSSEMELATPLMPTVLLESPAMPLEVEDVGFDSPNPLPVSPSVVPSPFQLSPETGVVPLS